MDGANAVHALKRHVCTATIPVIGLTAYDTASTAEDFRQVCDAVLEKPVSPDALLDALRRARGTARW
jgi:CheY-like chemotaxis protein